MTKASNRAAGAEEVREFIEAVAALLDGRGRGTLSRYTPEEAPRR